MRLAQSRGTKPLRVRRLVERQAELEDARRPSVVAPERELERLLADVLAQQDDLVALEQVRDAARDQLSRAAGGLRVLADGRGSGSARTGPSEPLEDGGHLHLDVLGREDERGRRPALVGDLLQQRRVDVDADAEREDPPPVRVALAGQLADRGFRGLPDRRQPVGHEQDDRQRPVGGRLPEGLEEGVVDVGAAPRGHPFEELGRRP